MYIQYNSIFDFTSLLTISYRSQDVKGSCYRGKFTTNFSANFDNYWQGLTFDAFTRCLRFLYFKDYQLTPKCFKSFFYSILDVLRQVLKGGAENLPLSIIARDKIFIRTLVIHKKLTKMELRITLCRKKFLCIKIIILID